MSPSRPALARPWGWAVLSVACLAPFFFLSYGYATNHTASLPHVRSIAYGWEHSIPFWPWTIVPYWSIDLLYGISLLLCTNRRELFALVRSLVTIQILAISCFLLFPLRFSFDRPRPDGVFGTLFDLLMGFDKPFNQAPSLHIGLLTILWIVYARHTQGLVRVAIHIWFFLIGLSVLTTYQHHFLDLPTGALAGALAFWLWPHEGDKPWRHERSHWVPGLLWLLAAVGSAVLAWRGGAWLWVFWPSVSFALLAFHYLVGGAHGFQKTGRWPSAAATLLHAPYLLGAWINSRFWTWNHPHDVEIGDGIWLGRHPSKGHLVACGYQGVLDLAAELPGPNVPGWVGYPLLDLAPPTAAQLSAAADLLEAMRFGKVLVCCALGYGRSASVVAAWLIRTGRSPDAPSAISRVLEARPQAKLATQALAQVRALLPQKDGPQGQQERT